MMARFIITQMETHVYKIDAESTQEAKEIAAEMDDGQVEVVEHVRSLRNVLSVDEEGSIRGTF